MGFTVQDFHDLLRLLEDRPDWRADLRRLILSEEMLDLPAVVRELAEAQAQTEQQLRELAQAQARTEQRVEELAEAQARTEQALARLEQRVGELAEAQARTGERVSGVERQLEVLATQMTSLVAQVSTLGGHVGELRGEALEARYHRHYTGYFGRLARRLRLVDTGQLGELLESAVDSQVISREDAEKVLLADLVLAGRRPDDEAEVYLVIEVSVGIGVSDVQRAYDRAQLLAHLGRPAVPVVAGLWINPEAMDQARAMGVQQVLDGRAVQVL